MAATALFCASCEQDLPVWEDQTARLNFYNENKADTLTSYCFVYHNEVPQDTIWMRVTTMGFPADHDRQFELVQVTTGDNDAEAGKHYVGFDNAELRKHYVIKADSVGAFFPVVVLRHDSEADKVYNLKFTIKDNDEFKVGYQDFLYKYVAITDMLVKPSNWGGDLGGRDELHVRTVRSGETQVHDEGQRRDVGRGIHYQEQVQQLCRS